MMFKFLRNIVVLSALISCGSIVLAQEQTKPSTLFEYPVAPDTISTLEGRTNYIVSKFWDNYNLSKPIKDSIAFDKTFRDYITFFKYAHRTIVFTSIKDFMNKSQSNKANFLMIMEIAEKALYAPGAEYWSDDAYLQFARFFVQSKNVKSADKERYKAQIKTIEKTLDGAIAPDFELTTIDKSKVKLSDIKDKWVILFFEGSDCDDCSIARLRLSTDVTINKNIDEGVIAVVSIYPGKFSNEWAESARTYSDKWIVGACDDIVENYDMRISPCFYFLDKDHKILGKNLTLVDIKNLFVQ